MVTGQPKWFVTTRSWLGALVPFLTLMLPLFGQALSPDEVVTLSEFVQALIASLGMGVATWGVIARKTTTVPLPGEGVSVNPLD